MLPKEEGPPWGEPQKHEGTVGLSVLEGEHEWLAPAHAQGRQLVGQAPGQGSHLHWRPRGPNHGDAGPSLFATSPHTFVILVVS